MMDATQLSEWNKISNGGKIQPYIERKERTSL